MLAYIIRRFLLLVFVLFGVSVLLFSILMTFSPERRAAAYVTTPLASTGCPVSVGLRSAMPATSRSMIQFLIREWQSARKRVAQSCGSSSKLPVFWQPRPLTGG